MLQREQAERSRQRIEQKIKQNELQQQLAAKKDRQGRTCCSRLVCYINCCFNLYQEHRCPAVAWSGVCTWDIIIA